jgi:hypothetical protein
MWVIKRQQRDAAFEWLVTVMPVGWGVLDQAMRFETRREAERAASTIKLSGDWSIDPAGAPPITI